MLAGTLVLYTTAPSLAEMTATQRAQRVALVEEVKGKVTGVELMDYVAPGTVIKLGPKDSIYIHKIVLARDYHRRHSGNRGRAKPVPFK